MSPHFRPFFALVLCLAAITPATAQRRSPAAKPTVGVNTGLSAAAIYKKVGPSVVWIQTADVDGNPESQGSGFIIGHNRVVTAYHVVKGAFTVYVGTLGSDNLAEAKVARIDKEADLALIVTEKLTAPELPVAMMSSIQPGAKVYALGNPKGLEGSISDGIVSGTRETEQMKYIQITAAISPGSSGGPVVNERGEVIGIADFFLKGGQSLNFAVPSDYCFALNSGVRGEAFNHAADWLDNGKPTTAPAEPPVPESVVGALRAGESFHQASLRKLAGVAVSVIGPGGDIASVISAQEIRSAAELQLRRYGVRVLGEQEAIQTPGGPMLIIHLDGITAVSGNGTAVGYAYQLSVELEQGAFLSRDPNFFVLTPTWARGTIATSGMNFVRDSVFKSIDNYVGMFISDYLRSQ